MLILRVSLADMAESLHSGNEGKTRLGSVCCYSCLVRASVTSPANADRDTTRAGLVGRLESRMRMTSVAHAYPGAHSTQLPPAGYMKT